MSRQGREFVAILLAILFAVVIWKVGKPLLISHLQDSWKSISASTATK